MKQKRRRPPTPNKRSPEREAFVLKRLRLGASKKAAAEAAGVSEQALHYWCRASSDFAEAVRLAEATAAAEREAALEASA